MLIRRLCKIGIYLSFFSLLSAFELRREDNGHLTLFENTCEQVQSTAKDFSAWKNQSDGPSTCQISAQVTRSSRGVETCAADVTSCLPEHVQKYQGVNPEAAGPNCWNLALVMAKILPNHRYTSDEEFTFYLRPPLCRAIATSEEKKPGDIGLLKTEGNRGSIGQLHAFIHINKYLSYTKNSWLNITEPFQVQSVNEMVEVQSNYAQNKSEADKDEEFRIVGEQYFRCQSMSEYLKNSKGIPPELLKAFQHAGQIDACLERSAMTGTALSSGAQKNIRQTAQALLVYLEEKRAQSPPPKVGSDEEFMLGALQVRLISMADQMHMWNMPKEHADLQVLARTIEESRVR